MFWDPTTAGRLLPVHPDFKVDRLRQIVSEAFRFALLASHPAQGVRQALERRWDVLSNLTVGIIAVGKAAVPMARAASDMIPRMVGGGLVVTKHGHGDWLPPGFVLLESGHPVPDSSSFRAGEAVLRALENSEPPDLLLVLISGGASSLVEVPMSGLSEDDLGNTTLCLLRAGADIHQLNTVRKHLSRLKGGGLLSQARSSRVLALLLSDVIDDDLSVIGSGLTSPDPSTFADAWQVVTEFGLEDRIPEPVRLHLEAGRKGLRRETLKPGCEGIPVENVIIGSGALARDSAANQLRDRGIQTLVLPTAVSGEAAQLAGHMSRSLSNSSGNGASPLACVAFGETVVNVRGSGRGGRNQEAVLAALEREAWRAWKTPFLFACLGTDGTDGPTDAAGAFMDSTSRDRALDLKLDAARFLLNNDSYTFFDDLGDLIRTGPTGTNVGDVTILLQGEISSSSTRSK